MSTVNFIVETSLRPYAGIEKILCDAIVVTEIIRFALSLAQMFIYIYTFMKSACAEYAEISYITDYGGKFFKISFDIVTVQI